MKLFFRKEGSGDPLVILHGLYGSSDNWIGIARKLSAKYTVYCIDLRNHGHSPHDPEHTYNAMKEDLALFINENIAGRVILLGHSMGGKTAMWYAAGYPDRIKKLIVADIAPKNYLEGMEKCQLCFHQNVLRAMQEADISGLKNRQQVEEKLAAKIDDLRIVHFLLKNVTTDPVSRQLKWRLNVKVLYDYLGEIVGGVNGQWFDDRVPITAYPVEFIRGLESPYITDNDIQGIRKIYPEATVVDIPEAGHWLHAEQPELFLKAVCKL